MNEPHDPLDRLLAELPRSVEPSRDLWRDIEAEIAADKPRAGGALHTQRWFQLAAALVLVVTSSVMTFFVMRTSTQEQIARARQEVAEQMQPVLPTTPVRFDSLGLDKRYEQLRAELDAEYSKHIQYLPPMARAKVERDIAELRRSADEIAATLAQYPSDPLLQDLLVSTYQREMQVLSEVNSMAASTAAGTDL
mgnify:CR=1 FL=1|jgi:HAMP domain-containing protein